jgi:hypothetical protein
MSLWSKVRGTIESIFQIGLSGPNVKNNAGNIEFRNAGDSGFVIARGASPIGDNDLVTKQYADTLNKPIVVTAQFDGNNALPANTGVEHFIVVSTTGANASIGQVLWDDGSGAGTVTVLAALEGRSIFTSAAFAGGTVTFRANSYYVWDTVSGSWLLEANSTMSGSVREVRYVINNSATQDSASADVIPANAVVNSAELKITTPYSGGAMISIGQPGNTTLLQLTTDNLPQGSAGSIYQVMQDTSWGGLQLSVRTTVGGAPAAGAGVVIVRYAIPDA